MKNFKNNEKNAALDLLVRIERLGHVAYLVGGCVRDMVMGIEPHDFDIVTACPIEELEEFFPCHDIGQSKDFGITSVNHKGFSFEVAQMRVDGEYTDGRHPDEVMFVDNIEEDLARRDLTINAMAMDFQGNVIDPFGGAKDIQNRIIRAVGDADARFCEDFLRMLRTARFAGRFNFEIERETKIAIFNLCRNVNTHVKPERIQGELYKMASSSGEVFARTVNLMCELGLLREILPEVDALNSVKETPRHHPEAYEFGNGSSFHHTLHAVRQNVIEDPVHNIAVLLHDVGKPVCHSWNEEKQRFTMNGHDVAGVELINNIADRLKFSNKDREIFVFCAKSHMKILHVREMRKSTAVRLVCDDKWEFLKNVMFCDDSSRLHKFDEKHFNETIEMLERIREEHNNRQPKIVDGRQVMEITGIKPSPEVGRIIKEVTANFFDADGFVCIRKLVKDAVK